MNLNSIFNPQSIAIIGASTKVGSVGNDVVKNLREQGYKGKLYPVNPKADELYSLKCYANISDINDQIDLAIVIVPAAAVPEVMREAAVKGVKGAIVISAGFKEVGNAALENELKQICLEHDIALVGPNCLGVLNPKEDMNASFAIMMPKKGKVAFISQSGALVTAILDYAKKLGIGFSKFVSVGNKAVMDEVILLNYLADDKDTKVIAMYVEDLSRAQEIIAIAKKMAYAKNPKPIIILKSGRTTAGASASVSHTGSLAGNDAAYDALFKQSGIIRADKVSEMFEYIQAFSNNKLPAGRNAVIITNAGGPGVLTTDEVVSNGLQLAELSEETAKALKEYLPPAANTHNPIDVLGDAKADRYKKALELAAQDWKVDSILVLLTPQSMTEIKETAQAIADIKKITEKPIIACFMGDDAVKKGVKLMQSHKVATIQFPEQAAKALSVITRFGEWTREKEEADFQFNDVNKEQVAKIFADAKREGKISFPEAEALKILAAYNFSLLKSEIAKTASEAKDIAQKIGGKMVMKIVSPDILHKSDVGGVMLNITEEMVEEKFNEMMQNIKMKAPNARIEGVLLAEMAEKGGAEFILGSSKDPSLGSLIMAGLGGIYVEVFGDVAFGLAPVTKDDARKMISRLKAKKILDGARGQGKLDAEALIECIGRLSQLLADFPEIKELDINPLLVLPEGVKVLDARIVIG